MIQNNITICLCLWFKHGCGGFCVVNLGNTLFGQQTIWTPRCDNEMPRLWQTVTVGDELLAFSAVTVVIREILQDSLQYLQIITLWLRGCEDAKTQAH